MKLDRLLAIVMLIINRRRVNAEELARYFEVSVRTIYRDIDAINMAGIPVIAYPGKNGGFGLMEGYTIDRHVLTHDEMFSIVTSLRGLGRSVPGKRAMDTAEKLTTLLPEDERERLNRRGETIIIDASPWSNAGHMKKRVEAIMRAIEEGRVLALSYLDAQGAPSRRRVEPMTLVLKGSVWYFFGYCRTRKDFRLFRLSRIKSMLETGETFTRRDARYDPDQWTEAHTAIKSIDLLLRFDPVVRVHVEDYFLPEQIKPQKDGSLLVSARLPWNDWIASMVLSYGDAVEVLAPEELRSLVRGMAAGIVEKNAAGKGTAVRSRRGPAR